MSEWRVLFVVVHCIYCITDPCDSVVCENDGTYREIDSETYECDCAPGFSGMNCQTGRDLLWILFQPVKNCTLVAKGIISQKHEAVLA